MWSILMATATSSCSTTTASWPLWTRTRSSQNHPFNSSTLTPDPPQTLHQSPALDVSKLRALGWIKHLPLGSGCQGNMINPSHSTTLLGMTLLLWKSNLVYLKGNCHQVLNRRNFEVLLTVNSLIHNIVYMFHPFQN